MSSTGDAQKMADKNNPNNTEPNFWEKFLTWTQFVYMIRVPIVAGLVIFLFPLIVFFLAPTLLRGLYDLTEHPFLSSIWFSLFTFLFGWTVMISAKLVLFYGGERLGVENHIQVWFRENVRKKYLIKYRVIFILVFLGASLTLSGIFWVNRLTGKFDLYLLLRLISGLIIGLIAALILLFLADLIQSYLYEPHDAESLKHLLFPFDSKILERMRQKRHDSSGKTRKNRIIDWIKSNRIVGRGYFCYDEPGAPLQSGHSTAMVLFVVFLVIYILFGFSYRISAFISSIFVHENYDIPWGVPAIVYIPILAAVLCWALSAMSFFLDSYRIPLLVPVVFAVIVMSFIFNRGHEYQTVSRAATERTVVSPQEITQEGKEDYIIVVTADGGGIQAAAWTAQVLSGIEEACRNEIDVQGCSSKIRLISSVSGGSIGAMYFVNAFDADRKGLPADNKELQAIVDRAETSSLKYVAWGLAYPDFLNNILPVFDTDRGQELEKAWADNNYIPKDEQKPEDIKALKESLTKPLSTWKEGVKEKWRPAVIFNTTIAETGERFLISTADVKKRIPDDNRQESAKTADDCSRIAKENINNSATGSRNFYQLFPCDDIPIMTAARLSASFPYVSPAAKSKIKGDYNNYNSAHIVDGGYYDNYGIVSLSEWLDEFLRQPNHPTKVLVVQIRCNDTGYNSVEDPTDGWLYQILAPLNTLYNVRTSGQRSRGDLEFKQLQENWMMKDVNIQSVVFNFALKSPDNRQNNQSQAEREKECPAEKYKPPLSWHLTSCEKEMIKRAWNTNLNTENEGWKQFKKILACFRGLEKCEAEPKNCLNQPEKQQGDF